MKKQLAVDQILIILRENPELASKVLGTLPEKEAFVIKSIYIDLMPYSEIANELDVAEHQIRAIKKTAIFKLRHPSRLNSIKDSLL